MKPEKQGVGMAHFEATISFPPSISHYYREYKGRRIMSKQGRAFRDTAVKQLLASKREPTLQGRIRMTMILNPPDGRRRDIDNYCKSAMDAITHAGIWDDDEQVDELIVRRGSTSRPGSAHITLERIE